MHTHTLNTHMHTDSDAHSHLLYYECLAHTRRILDTWIVLTIRIAVCNLLTFSAAEWQRLWEGWAGGALSIGTRSAHFEALKTALAHHGNAYINRCDENLKRNFGNFFAADLFFLSLPLLPPLLPLPLRFICFTIFFNYFNATNMSAYFVLKGIFPVSAQRFFLFLWLLLFCQFTTHAHPHV